MRKRRKENMLSREVRRNNIEEKRGKEEMKKNKAIRTNEQDVN